MKKILYFVLFFPIMVIGQTTSENYVRTKTYKIETTTSIASPTVSEANQSITYFDGLGRPIQQIAHQQSASGNSIVTPIEYDAFGRQVKDYLPYATNSASLNYISTALTDVGTFYNTTAFESTTNPFSLKELEASPLNRVLKQAAPGNDWSMANNHVIRFDYQTNIANEVKLFNVTADGTTFSALGYYNPLLTDNGYYSPNELYKTITKDENWKTTDGNNNTTEEFKDKQGRIVLKRTYNNGVKHDTYYIYDQFGNLTFVLPPLVNTTATITTAVLDGLCYQYKYDNRNRLVEKKLPGKQWEFIVYDKLDRVVATGPALSPFTDAPANTYGWLVTKYDVFNRVIYTGWQSETTAFTSTLRSSRQNTVSALTVLSENKTVSSSMVDGVNIQYSNNVILFSTPFKLLTANYYDDYSFPNAPTIPTSVEGQTVFYNATTKPKGLSTGSYIRVLETASATNAEKTYTLYDEKARPIRSYNINHLGGFTQIDSKLDWAGKILYIISVNSRSTTLPLVTVKESFEYSLQDKLLKHTHQINGGTIQLLAKNEYDELGQLIVKRVGGTDLTGVSPLQKVDYNYNIRGWLKGINNTNNLVETTGNNDLFSFKINYNTVENVDGYTGTSLYNGNISETYWRSSSDAVLRKYGYQYDNLNRMTNSIYQKPENAVIVTNSYNESLAYDKNGNITALQRNGALDDDIYPVLMDDLVYGYNITGNKPNSLINVADNTNDISGFKDGTNTNNDYSYDDNGNMTADLNKDITSITYNHLNLPIKILFGNGNNIEYLYNAIGQKLNKIVREGTVFTKTEYLSGFQYKNEELKFFIQAEGYVNVTVGKYNVLLCNYAFNYTDHLGNIRLTYGLDPSTNVLKIMEENHYYPFGLKHTNYNSQNNMFVRIAEEDQMRIKFVPPVESFYKLKFNGKSWEDELGLNFYDYGARNYDATIGRWMNMDAMSEKYYDWSSYNYAINNPVNVIDPDGNDIYILIWATDRKNKRYGHAAIAVDNYKEVNKKDENGNNLIDENGNSVTEMVKDGTFTFYDLWPGVDLDNDGIGDDFGEAGPNFNDSFIGLPGYYRKMKINNFNGDPSDAEGYEPDGIIRLNAGYEETMEAVEDLNSYMKSNKNYKSALNNCSTFSLEATLEPLDKMGAFTSKGSMESYLGGYINIITPNQLYKYLQKIVTSNPTEGRVVKSAGNKVDERFTSDKEIKDGIKSATKQLKN